MTTPLPPYYTTLKEIVRACNGPPSTRMFRRARHETLWRCMRRGSGALVITEAELQAMRAAGLLRIEVDAAGNRLMIPTPEAFALVSAYERALRKQHNRAKRRARSLQS